MKPNMNESSLIYEHRSRIQAIEKELENRREPDERMQELLIRLDERIKEFNRRMMSMEKKLIPPSDYNTLVEKVEKLEADVYSLKSWRVKVVAKTATWITILTLVVATGVAILQDLVSKLFFV